MIRVSEGRGAFFYAKVPADDVRIVPELTDAGFLLVDTNVTLARLPKPFYRKAFQQIQVRDAHPESFKALQDIAAKCFKLSRFHRDLAFTEITANLVKRKWIENYCSGHRGEVLYEALIDSTPVGFLAVDRRTGQFNEAAIDLIGVAPDRQGLGVGKALVSKFIEQWSGCSDRLVVGTQLINCFSLSLYMDFGFRIAHSTYVFHAHLKEAN